MIPLTRSIDNGSPTDTECERMMFSWSLAVSSLPIALVQRAPKPVVTPYMTFSSETHCSTSSRDFSTRLQYSSENSTAAPYLATAMKSSSVIGAPNTIFFILLAVFILFSILI